LVSGTSDFDENVHQGDRNGIRSHGDSSLLALETQTTKELWNEFS
jgi:hypothetical protein